MKISNTGEYLFLIDEKEKNLVAYYPLKEHCLELNLPLLPNPFKIDVKTLADNSWEGCDGCDENDKYFWKKGFRQGYNSADSKLFTLEDMKNLWNYFDEKALNWMDDNKPQLGTFENYIQSLSTQQLPIEFIPEYDTKTVDNSNDFLNPLVVTEFTQNTYKSFKFVTNLHSKKELVGTYKY